MALKPPPPSPHLWPDGKHRRWKTLDPTERQTIVLMIRHGQSTEAILRRFPHVSVGTVAAVRAARSRRR